MLIISIKLVTRFFRVRLISIHLFATTTVVSSVNDILGSEEPILYGEFHKILH